jgi:non-specific serine/threonine protein kinase
MLRLSASCGNEVIDALARPAHQQASALQRVAQRYARVLGISLKDVQMAAQGQPPEPPSGQEARATNFSAL